MRSVDPCFAKSEALYRRISIDQVDGDRILASAVEMPACSFDRSKYSTRPESVIDRAKPEFNGIAKLMVGDMPAPVSVFGVPDKGPPASYEFYPEDLPEPDNEAHSEVRIRISGKPFRKRVNDRVAVAACEALAAPMRVHTPPT